MTSEIRTNSITSRAGMSTVTMTDSGPMFSGITTFVDNSGFTFGVGGGTSIFTPATNVLTFGTNNTEKVRIDANGDTNIAGVTTAANFKTGVSNLHDVGLTLSGGQIDVGSNIKIGTAGVVTATSFSGSGANLTNLPTATSITVADESTDTTCYPLYVTATSGNLAPKTGTNLVFNSASGNLRTASVFCGTSSNESKTQDGLILERNSGDGEVHITAGRSGGNYSGMQFYVAGGSGVTKRYQIDYQSNHRWYGADGTTERLRIRSDGKISAGTSLNASNTYEFSLTGADATGGFYAHGRNHYLSNRSNAYASLTLKKSNSDSDATDYFQLRDSSNNLKASISGAGNWKPIAGGGIDFSATSDASGMSSELLDDYEEGSFTPQFDGLSNTPSYAARNGRYTKIGRYVHITGIIQTGGTNPTFSNTSSILKLTGMPFVGTGVIYYVSLGNVSHQHWDCYGSGNNENNFASGDADFLYCQMEHNTSNMIFMMGKGSQTRARVRNNSMHNSGAIIIFELSYTV